MSVYFLMLEYVKYQCKWWIGWWMIGLMSAESGLGKLEILINEGKEG